MRLCVVAFVGYMLGNLPLYICEGMFSFPEIATIVCVSVSPLAVELTTPVFTQEDVH